MPSPTPLKTLNSTLSPTPPLPPPRSPWPVYLALVAVQVFYGVHYLAAKAVTAELPPRGYTALRVWGGTLLLLLLTRAMGLRLPTDRGTLGRLALYSIFGVILNQTLFAEGILRTSPIHSSLINTTIPIATLLIAVLLRRESLTGRRVSALAVGLSGALLVIRPGSEAIDAGMLAGDLLTWANATSFSLFLVLSKPLLMRIAPISASAMLMVFGSIGMIFVGGPVLWNQDWTTIGGSTWAWLAYAIVFPTAGAMALQYWALTRVESSFLAFFIYLQPVVATGLAFMILGDSPTPLDWAGAVLIFVAVALAHGGSRRARNRT